MKVYAAAAAFTGEGGDTWAQGYPKLRFVYSLPVPWVVSQFGSAFVPLFLTGFAAIVFLLCARTAYLWGRVRPTRAILPVFGLMLGVFVMAAQAIGRQNRAGGGAVG